MTFAIAGTTGHTGKVVADTLLARGKKVRVIVRDAGKGAAWKARGAEVAVADLGDASALTKALTDVEGVYLLNPPNVGAKHFREYQDGVSRALADAVGKSRVPHVVFLSSVGAQHAGGNGPIAGLHVTEKLFNAIPTTVFSFVRAGYFLENIGATLPAARDGGVLPSFFPADLAFPMTNTTDIGRLAAQQLLEKPRATEIIALGTDRSYADLAKALGTLLKREVKVQEAPVSAVTPTFESFGFPHDLAALYQEMIEGVRSGHVRFGGERRVRDSEPLDKALAALL